MTQLAGGVALLYSSTLGVVVASRPSRWGRRPFGNRLIAPQRKSKS